MKENIIFGYNQDIQRKLSDDPNVRHQYYLDNPDDESWFEDKEVRDLIVESRR